MKRSHMIALIREATKKSIYESYLEYGETWLLDSYLNSGFVGYDNMTTDELWLELNEFVDGHYAGWDDEGGEYVAYECKNGEWINQIAEAA